MSKSIKKEKQTIRENFEERVFNIKLKTTLLICTNQRNQDINFSQHPQFVKIIQQEYATKYLESLNIEANQKNIQMILKKYPLENCEISAGWNNSGGLYADNITIIARHKKNKKKMDQSQLGQLKLKKNVEVTQVEAEKSPQANVEPENEEEKQNKFRLSYEIDDIKKNYLFPFNQSFSRRMNVNLRNNDQSDLPNLGENTNEHDKFLIFESKTFTFPFIHIEVLPNLLKELQKPPSVFYHYKIINNQDQCQPEDIEKIVKGISKCFPKNIFPLHNSEETLNSRHIKFHENDIKYIFSLIESKEMIKFIGIFMHFSYWLVFGITQPIQIESLTKKQMFIQMFEIIEYFQSKTRLSRLWMLLFMPMILITLKMTSEFLYKNLYPSFFEQSPGQVALDKIFYLIERVFDQNNLYCRFIFLESDFKKSQQKGVVNDRKFMQKRIFGISPYMDLLITNPQDGKSRTILARQHDIDIHDNVLSITKQQPNKFGTVRKGKSEQKQENFNIEKAQKQKMFNIVLTKMDQDIENALGKKSMITFKNN